MHLTREERPGFKDPQVLSLEWCGRPRVRDGRGNRLRGPPVARMMMPIGAGLRPVDVPPSDSLRLHTKGCPIMSRLRRTLWLVLALAVLIPTSRGDDRRAPPDPAPSGDASRVYGEWRIRVRPDQGPAYNRLIEQSGLPLFRAAGGRMVGWWNTLIGDLYEHVTIWEYDDMAAFERAIGFLSKNPAFARFVE